MLAGIQLYQYVTLIYLILSVKHINILSLDTSYGIADRGLLMLTDHPCVRPFEIIERGNILNIKTHSPSLFISTYWMKDSFL